MSSGKWRPFCVGLNVLIEFGVYSMPRHNLNQTYGFIGWRFEFNTDSSKNCVGIYRV